MGEALSVVGPQEGTPLVPGGLRTTPKAHALIGWMDPPTPPVALVQLRFCECRKQVCVIDGKDVGAIESRTTVCGPGPKGIVAVKEEALRDSAPLV